MSTPDIPIRTGDIVVILIYLGCLIPFGLYFARRNNTTERYFVGNRSFSGWAIGLSMLGAVVSSMTFIALPAAAYVLDWRQLAVNLVLPFVALLAILVFIPFFRHGRLTSAFEYLGKRYGTIPRMYGTFSFIIIQVIRMAQILFLVALVIQFLTGAPIVWVIIGTGLFIAFYTVSGGIEAVVWTDVLQAIIMMAGGIICTIYVAIKLPGGIEQVIDIGTAHDKFSLGSLNFDLTKRTFYSVAILGIIHWLTIYAGDQNIVQRYVAARSMREARKATAIYSIIAIPLWTLFFFIGTSLFAYYIVFPDPVVTGLEADQIFPYFILTKIPTIISGIIISAILAAAMSTMSSGVNAISTVSIVDLMKPWLAKNRTDKYYLRSAKMIASIVAIVVVIIAIVFSQIKIESMNNISLIVASVFGGCLMGLFMMGFFTQRVDGISATIALILAVGFNIYLGLSVLGQLPPSLTISINSYWVGALVNGCFIILAYLISLIRGVPLQELKGLTIFSMLKNSKLK